MSEGLNPLPAEEYTQMADESPYPDSDGGSHGDTDDNTGTPRWVKVFGLVALVLALLFVILMLTGHGPGRHLP